MARYVALLRAINVGGQHAVKMDRLRALFEELGFRGVETFIASGNVIFECRSASADAIEQRIEKHLKAKLGYDVATMLRTPDELAAVAAYEPFAVDGGVSDTDALYVSFTKRALADAAHAALLALRTATDDFHANGREVYWRCRTKLSETRVSGAALERAFAMPSTMRNVTTVRKLARRVMSEV